MNKAPIHISITAGSVINIILVLLGVYVLYLLRDLLLLVFTAIILASAIEPGVEFFKNRLRLHRVLAVIAMYGIVFGTVFASIYYFIPPILDEAQSFLALLPQYLETIELPTSIGNAGFIGSETTIAKTGILDSLLALQDSFSNTGEGIVRLLSTIFGGIFSLFLTIVLSFYFAVRETGIDDFLRLVTPLKHQKYVLDLWGRSQKKIGLWMQGQILLSFIIGILVYLGLMILGVPYALLLAVFAAVLELIPMFGSIIAAIPALIVAFVDGGASLALIVGGLFLVVNQFQANLIYPLVVKKVIGVPPLLVILAIIAGGQLAGVIGVILSVPIAAGIGEFVSDFQKKRISASIEKL
ncbi:AI-2E family transporter [Candidatus Wolfebacteria bacterium]|nr:AI-2E family transporter [Candidatus Wolfebacteria bacterium]